MSGTPAIDGLRPSSQRMADTAPRCCHQRLLPRSPTLASPPATQRLREPRSVASPVSRSTARSASGTYKPRKVCGEPGLPDLSQAEGAAPATRTVESCGRNVVASPSAGLGRPRVAITRTGVG